MALPAVPGMKILATDINTMHRDVVAAAKRAEDAAAVADTYIAPVDSQVDLGIDRAEAQGRLLSPENARATAAARLARIEKRMRRLQDSLRRPRVPTVTPVLSAAGAASQITSPTTVLAIPDVFSGVLSPTFRYLATKPVQAGTVFPDREYVKSTGLTHPTGSLPYVVEFDTDSAKIEIIRQGNDTTAKHRISVDGVPLTVDPQDGAASSLSSQYLVYFDLGSAKQRRVRVEFAGNARFKGVNVEAGRSVTRPEGQTGPRLIVMGDSFVEGTGATGITSFGKKTARLLDWWDAWASGVGSTGYVEPGTTGKVKFRDRVQADVIDHAPDVVVVAGGINDRLHPPSSVGTEAGLLFDAIISGVPAVELLVVGPWWPNGSPPADILAVRDAIKAKATARGLLFVDPIAEGWITGNGNAGAPNGSGNADVYISSDGTHPTPAGHRYLGRRLAARINDLTLDTYATPAG